MSILQSTPLQNRQLSAIERHPSQPRHLLVSKLRRYHPTPPNSNQPPLSELHPSTPSIPNHKISKVPITAIEKPRLPRHQTSIVETSELQPVTTMSASITSAQVKEHASPEKGLYIIIDNSVYSMADFADEHPGGSKILKRVGGKGKLIPSLTFLIFLLQHRDRQQEG